ncbi:hypothetical protein IW492_06805 [Enterococcus sp. BWB1-3]|uniref:C47 family peptidase n=1 Tax=Enterococcus sp. BWB1-3 TaxID=2787713 RepID=UPI0019234442|nr:C47 family peptidase [Enterococcus sp. BWB1-3]MBL1228940.1 hypothetical protein [Enterococcus sp. BWB1-3]
MCIKKKLATIMIIVSGIFVSAFIFENRAYAANNETELEVQSPSIDDDVRAYASNTLQFSLQSYIQVTENRLIKSGEYKLSEPFSLVSVDNEETTSIYPVIGSNGIEYTFFVNYTEDGQFSSKLTKLLVNELNDLMQNTENCTFIFFEKSGSIYSETSGIVDMIYENPDPQSESLPAEKVEQEILDVKDETVLETIKLDENLTPINPTVSRTSRSVTNNSALTMIDWSITQTQGSEPLCAAYAVAMILNNKNDKRPTAVSDITAWATNSKIDYSRGFTEAQMIQYANSRGVYPYFVNGILSRQDINTQILRSNAIYARWYRDVGDGTRGYHAIDIIGIIRQPIMFDSGENVGYLVWNPWYNYTEMVDANNPNSISYSVPGRTYKWFQTMTNW